MKAAVVERFGDDPRVTEVAEPTAAGPDEVVVDVLAAALSPRVRAQAAGSHYTSTDQLPLIPGIDGVGRLPDGGLVYFLLPDTTKGAMAERVTIDVRRSVPLPTGADPVAVAAVMNPAMASWVALRRRTELRPGQGVLVLGATGSAGRAALQVAGRLGAGEVVAAGRGVRDPRELRALGATRVVELDDDHETVGGALAEAGKDVDVVLDFLWGEPTRDALLAIVPNRSHDEQLLTWIQIGSVAGPEASIPSAALRAVNLRLVGSGQGSVTPDAYREEIRVLAEEVLSGTFGVSTRVVPLERVQEAWAAPAGPERVVVVP